MNTKKAIEFLEEEIKYWGPTISSNMKKVPYECEPGNPLAVKIYKEIIKLLQRGEINQKIIDKMKNGKYDVWVSLPGHFTNLPDFVRDIEKEVIK